MGDNEEQWVHLLEIKAWQDTLTEYVRRPDHACIFAAWCTCQLHQYVDARQNLYARQSESSLSGARRQMSLFENDLNFDINLLYCQLPQLSLRARTCPFVQKSFQCVVFSLHQSHMQDVLPTVVGSQKFREYCYHDTDSFAKIHTTSSCFLRTVPIWDMTP